MSQSKDESVEIEDDDFQAFLNESLSDEDPSAVNRMAAAAAAKVQDSGDTSSVWWVEDKESVLGSTLGRKRGSFMKTSNAVSDDFASSRPMESFTATTSESADEGRKADDMPAPSGARQLLIPTEVSEEPETSVADTSQREDSDPVLHSTLLGDMQSERESELFKTSETLEREPEDTANLPPSSSAVPATHSNLLSQVQLSDTGSLDLTLQNRHAAAIARKPSIIQQRDPESSITELDEDVSDAAVKRPSSEQSGSASAVDKKAVMKAMSTLISDQVASSDFAGTRPGDAVSDAHNSETTNSKTMPELIAEMEALDRKIEERPQTPPTMSSDQTHSASLHFAKSPYRPSSSQRTARVRTTGRSNRSGDMGSPPGTLNQHSGTFSNRALYSHVRSSGYGNPSYMPQLSRGSAVSSLSYNSRLGMMKLGGRPSDQYSTFGTSQSKDQFYGSASGEVIAKQKVVAYARNSIGTQTIADLESKKESEHWRRMWTESCKQVNDLQVRLEESDRSLAQALDRYQKANDALVRMRKSYASAKSNPEASTENVAQVRAVEELERLFSACQRDNEKLRTKIKDLEKENKHLAESVPGEMAELLEQLEKSRTECNELRRSFSTAAHQHEVEMTRLTSEIKRARSAEADFELRSAQLAEKLATLERKNGQLMTELENVREQYQTAIQSSNFSNGNGNKQSKTVVIAQKPKPGRPTKAGTGATVKPHPSVETEKAVKVAFEESEEEKHSFDNERSQLQGEIRKLQSALSQAEAEIERLQSRQRSLSPVSPTSHSGAVRIQKLEAAVRELEAMLREKHPGSVPAAVLEVAAAEAAASAEQIKQLEDRCRRLEMTSTARSPVRVKSEKSVQATLQQTPDNKRSYSAAVFADKNEPYVTGEATSPRPDGSANQLMAKMTDASVDDRLMVLRRHISDQDTIMTRLRNEANQLRASHLTDQAELVRLKGALAIVEKKGAPAHNSSQANHHEEMIATLLRERALAVKVETKLKADLLELNKRQDLYEQHIRELTNQLDSARASHTPERRLFDRLLDRLSELERRFMRREETIRELRAATLLGQPLPGSGETASRRPPANIDQQLLRGELDKLVQELHELRAKAALDSNRMLRSSIV